MRTYQDFEAAVAAGKFTDFVQTVIKDHQQSELYTTAVDADAYDHQRNTTIMAFRDLIMDSLREQIQSDIKIPCNLFHRLNKQRCSYLLGNGISFTRKEERNVNGRLVRVDVNREALGSSFDADVYTWGYNALIHGVSFGYWTPNRIFNFPVTQFAPLWDEETNALRAGVRFWRIDPKKPLFAEVYTEQGIYTLRSDTDGGSTLTLTDETPTLYKLKTRSTEARGEWVVGAENYSTLPVIPMYGSSLKQSTLVGMKARIDSIDMVASGFARDIRDCAKIYWLIENCGGMTEKDKREFLHDILYNHIAQVDSTSFSGDARAALTPYVQDVPYQSSATYLKQATEALYQDFGALDVHAIGANSTNDHLEAAFQPLNEETDDFEREVSAAIKQGLALKGIDDDPQYKRMNIVNQKERTDMIMSAVNLIGRRKALEKLDWIDVDEVDEIEQDEFAQGLKRLKPRTNPPQTSAKDIREQGTKNREQE